jgi:DNA polymerase-3 subunit gamma/tau
MSYEPLHHKYRPQTFAALVGQDAIATTLSNAIASRRIAPAYLFTGPRGTGKTSSARILAKSLNCISSESPTATPCGQCEVCTAIARGSALDVIEIDAASNTGVDNIREIIERAQFAPVQCRYKVYVIDECHMLSTAAFNALLKTLEEPPARVVFVLATTDPQRVLTTIISRCQRFDFRRIPLEAMVSHLQTIAQKESIEITDEAITLVAQIANGGLRDAESLLDQLSLLEGKIGIERVWDLVGAVPEQDLLTLLVALRDRDAEAVLECCRHLMDRGREPLAVLQSLAGFYLNLLIAKTSPQRQDLVAVTETTWTALCSEAQHWDVGTILSHQDHLKTSETQIKHSTQPRLWLEVTLLGLLNTAIASSQASPAAVPSASPSRPSQPVSPNGARPAAAQPQPEPPPPPRRETPSPASSSPPPQSENSVLENRVQQIWQRVLSLLPALPSALVKEHCQLVNFDVEAAIANIEVRNATLLKVAETHKTKIEKAFEQVWQDTIRVRFQVADASFSQRKINVASPPPVKKTPQSTTHPSPQSPAVAPLPKPSPPQPTSNPAPQPPFNGSSNGTAGSNNPAPQAVVEPPAPLADTSPATANDLDRAVQRLVKLFDGDPIDLDDEPEDPQPLAEMPIANSEQTRDRN